MTPAASVRPDTALLQVDGLRMHFFTKAGVVKAVDDVSFRVERGRILGLVGESGSGKSMTGYSILGLVDAPGRIVFRHLLPNCLPPLIVVATVQIAHAISLEATLSFLGLGLPVTEPSLGLLIANGFQYLLSGKYWISFYPGLALLLTIVSINLVADQLRDVLNPRLRR